MAEEIDLSPLEEITMIDLIDTEGRKENKGGEVINSIADDEYTTDQADPTLDDYLRDSIDEEEIMLNKEWVQALIDLDEAGYNKQ